MAWTSECIMGFGVSKCFIEPSSVAPRVPCSMAARELGHYSAGRASSSREPAGSNPGALGLGVTHRVQCTVLSCLVLNCTPLYCPPSLRPPTHHGWLDIFPAVVCRVPAPLLSAAAAGSHRRGNPTPLLITYSRPHRAHRCCRTARVPPPQRTHKTHRDEQVQTHTFMFWGCLKTHLCVCVLMSACVSVCPYVTVCICVCVCLCVSMSAFMYAS